MLASPEKTPKGCIKNLKRFTDFDSFLLLNSCSFWGSKLSNKRSKLSLEISSKNYKDPPKIERNRTLINSRKRISHQNPRNPK